MYDDDGNSFDYRGGAFARYAFEWDDAARRLTIRLAEGRLLSRSPREFAVRVAGSETSQTVRFEGSAPVTTRV